ncbi:MAG: pseudouridine-5'-phosphate glycosidase [Candidatus Cloacimonetes bacterium]|nr:pseudouridine-5'-phosphate glycosidase [Candidatus Cloacimonadota bacterium]
MMHLNIQPRVAQALTEGKPVLALESTIISHGMPFPQNLETAKMLEQLAIDHGVTPATICIMDGKVCVGLDAKQLHILATCKQVRKVTRRNFAEMLASGETGATTVAATMMAAHMAGIAVFATGGVGGVHRHAQETFDISADLIELSRTPVIVVSAGVKAILDIAKTLEYLETHGVPVYGFGTSTFPAFYSAKSPYPVEAIDSVATIAKIYQTGLELGFTNGMLVANPIPQEYEFPYDKMAVVIDKAIAEADQKGIRGQRVTPFLLGRIVELTGGKSLETNIALVKNNVLLGCRIARELVFRRF